MTDNVKIAAVQEILSKTVAEQAKEAFSAYIRTGIVGLGGEKAENAPGMQIPSEMEAKLASKVAVLSPIRAISGIKKTRSATLAQQDLGAAQVDLAHYPTCELYAMPAATQAFLDDTAVDLGEWIADEVNAAFAQQETSAFVRGNGRTAPRGFLNEPIVPNVDWQVGKLGFIVAPSGQSLDTVADALTETVFALKPGYRQNAEWVMNRKTQGYLRKIKDADGNYIWQPGGDRLQKANLLGFPITEADDMPDIGKDSLSIAFGDFRRGYLVVDRHGVNVLRDPYSAKPYVLFYTTKRVGGGVQDYDAIKLLKFGVE